MTLRRQFVGNWICTLTVFNNLKCARERRDLNKVKNYSCDRSNQRSHSPVLLSTARSFSGICDCRWTLNKPLSFYKLSCDFNCFYRGLDYSLLSYPLSGHTFFPLFSFLAVAFSFLHSLFFLFLSPFIWHFGLILCYIIFFSLFILELVLTSPSLVFHSVFLLLFSFKLSLLHLFSFFFKVCFFKKPALSYSLSLIRCI